MLWKCMYWYKCDMEGKNIKLSSYEPHAIIIAHNRGMKMYIDWSLSAIVKTLVIVIPTFKLHQFLLYGICCISQYPFLRLQTTCIKYLILLRREIVTQIELLLMSIAYNNKVKARLRGGELFQGIVHSRLSMAHDDISHVYGGCWFITWL